VRASCRARCGSGSAPRSAAGQTLGKRGHSGNSAEPHLHFQICDGPDPPYCAGLPVQFDGLDLVSGEVDRALQARRHGHRALSQAPATWWRMGSADRKT